MLTTIKEFKGNRLSAGMTLIELMIVVAIIGIIGAIAIPAYNGYIMEGRKSECHNEIAAIMLAQSQNFVENNTYFGGGSASAIEAASNGYYKATAEALNAGQTACTYAIQLGAGGRSYTLTATGANKLASEGVIETKTVN